VRSAAFFARVLGLPRPDKLHDAQLEQKRVRLAHGLAAAIRLGLDRGRGHIAGGRRRSLRGRAPLVALRVRLLAGCRTGGCDLGARRCLAAPHLALPLFCELHGSAVAHVLPQALEVLLLGAALRARVQRRGNHQGTLHLPVHERILAGSLHEPIGEGALRLARGLSRINGSVRRARCSSGEGGGGSRRAQLGAEPRNLLAQVLLRVAHQVFHGLQFFFGCSDVSLFGPSSLEGVE